MAVVSVPEAIALIGPDEPSMIEHGAMLINCARRCPRG
jgi:hypothetical protein